MVKMLRRAWRALLASGRTPGAMVEPPKPWPAPPAPSLVASPEPEPVPVEIIRFTQVALQNGRLTFWVGCEGCYELQMAYDLAGPWYPAEQGSCAKPVEITPRQDGGPQFFRAVSVPCPEPETQ